MNKLKSFIEKNSVVKSDCLIDLDMLGKFEEHIECKAGTMLKNYLLEYGFLMYGSVELYGITARLGLDSDMIKQTLYLHKYFPLTKGLIALENQGEGDYFLVSDKDRIFEYDSELKELTDTKLEIEDYILQRFNDAD